MQEVHCTRDDNLQLRESSPTQQLWAFVAVLIVVAKPRGHAGHAFLLTPWATFLYKSPKVQNHSKQSRDEHENPKQETTLPLHTLSEFQYKTHIDNEEKVSTNYSHFRETS
jgi:hypothetical protein